MLALFSLCALTELSNVLSLQTYSKRGMPLEEREHCIQARHRSRDLLDWVFSHYRFTRSQSELDPRTQIYWPYVVRIVKGLLAYKESATKSIDDSVRGCTLEAIEAQVKLCFENVTEYAKALTFWGEEVIETLAWPDDPLYTFTVQQRSSPKTRKGEWLHLFVFVSHTDRPSGKINGFTGADKSFQKR